jgi:hypothetical protein
MCQPLYFKRSVYTRLPAEFLCASAQNVRGMLFTSYSCHLTISFRCVDGRCLRIYGNVLTLRAQNIIRSFSHFPLISRNAMSSTCYYVIINISWFYSRCSKFLHHQFFCHREHIRSPNVSLVSMYSPRRKRQINSHGESDVTHYYQGYFIQGNKNRQRKRNIILWRFRATTIAVEKQ